MALLQQHGSNVVLRIARLEAVTEQLPAEGQGLGRQPQSIAQSSLRKANARKQDHIAGEARITGGKESLIVKVFQGWACQI